MISEAEVRQMVTAVVTRLLGTSQPPSTKSAPSGPAVQVSRSRLIYHDELRDIPPGGEVRLSAGSRLSPLAQELVLERKLRVVTAARTAAQDGAGPRTVALGADHGGFALKEALKKYLEDTGYTVADVGTKNTDAVDYPDFAFAVAKMVADGRAWRGIMVDGAGIGSCMVANKVPGIRASLCYDVSSAGNAREHNDANVLTLGGSLIGTNLAQQIVKTWLSTEFGGGRHARRVNKITEVEQRYARK